MTEITNAIIYGAAKIVLIIAIIICVLNYLVESDKND